MERPAVAACAPKHGRGRPSTDHRPAASLYSDAVRLCVPLVLALALAAGCDDAPQPLRPGERKPVRPAVTFAGTVQFAEELAQAPQAVIFVVIRNRNSSMPALTRRYEAGAIGTGPNGERVLPFRIGGEDDMAGMGAPLGDDLELQVIFDRDGSLETKDDAARATVPVRAGQADIRLTLDA